VRESASTLAQTPGADNGSLENSPLALSGWRGAFSPKVELVFARYQLALGRSVRGATPRLGRADPRCVSPQKPEFKVACVCPILRAPMTYRAADNRYQSMRYNRAGQSGLKLPAVSLGLWHNFGGVDAFENGRKMLLRAFDLGITHFDLANNYGPPAGSAEQTCGRVLQHDLRAHRDELVISSKAGYGMWPGPYGEWGSRKYLIASADQSLLRLGLEYVDIFYSHRFDPQTPLEETMGALHQLVQSGKALYVGISNYPAEETGRAARILRDLGTPCLIHQPAYSMFNRWIEPELLSALTGEKMGCIAFSPLAQGLLTDKYLNGIPEDSRAGKEHGFLRPAQVTAERLEQIRSLSAIASARGQKLAQMAIAWVLRHSGMTSALIGASRVSQIEDAVAALDNAEFSAAELARIDAIAPI
jgi:L-glyceraldehyde 3-phosphate reductase